MARAEEDRVQVGDILRLNSLDGACITTTVTNAGDDGDRLITFDVSGQQLGQFRCLCVNLTEDETKTLIRNLVASLNAYQVYNRAKADR